jgi:hypothetical protein
MRNLVVLDAGSEIGAIYSAGSHDGYVSRGDIRHPAIDCPEIVTDAPYYLFVKREIAKGGSTQKLYIPHSSVVAIHVYDDNESKPIGFVFANDAK